MQKKILTLFVFVVTIPLYMSAHAFEDGDLQLWNTDSLETKLNKSLKVKVEEELRFGDDVSELYYTHTDGGLTYGVNKNLDLGVNYRQIFEKKKGEWKEESRPHANATLKFTWEDFKFSVRNRLEMRIREGQKDVWRCREKFTVVAPWKWTSFEFQPYVADEMDIDFEGKKFTRNRLSAGFQFKLVENLKSDVFYMWQSSKTDDDWLDYNVIGIKLKAAF